MSTAQPPTKTSNTTETQLKPPDKEFWQHYSPHYEFPISTVATIALHACAIAVVIGIIALGLNLNVSVPPVPITAMTVGEPDVPKGVGGNEGASGNEPKEEVIDDRQPIQAPEIPLVDLHPKIEAIKDIPTIKDDPVAQIAIAKSRAGTDLEKVNEDLRGRIAKGFSQKSEPGEAPGPGTGATGDGPGEKGQPGPDPTTSGSRSSRWTIIFKTNSGEDYLKQLGAFQAKIVIPQPPDWKQNLLFDDILQPNGGKPLHDQDLPEMYFKDGDPESAAKVARALGLNFRPPYFIAFFPKNVELQLRDKEVSYRGLPEKSIYETKFRVQIRNGKYEITVVDQTPLKK